MPFLVAHVLRAQDQFFLRVQQPLSGLALARHHQLRREVARLAAHDRLATVVAGADGSTRPLSPFLSLHQGHGRCFGGAMSALIRLIDRHKLVAARRRRLLRVIESLVLLKNFLFRN